MCSCSCKNNILKILYSEPQEFSSYLPVKFTKCLFTNESAKLRARVLCVFTCLRAHVLCVLTCLRAQRACVLTCLACLRAQHACVLTCLVCLRACVRGCYDEMFYFLTCLRTWCAFLSYLLYISILKFKNSQSKQIVCFVKLNIFLIYILISTYKTI